MKEPAPLALTIEARRSGLLRDWLCLIRPRVASMVFLVAIAGACFVPGAEAAAAFEAALWITLVTGAASVFNQVLERDVDARMERTKDRPLPTGRIALRDAIFFGAALGAAGSLGLALRFNLLVATLGLATLLAYVAVYTPLKRVSTLNTVVGAIPGAMPPVLGYVALQGSGGPWAYASFATLFVWQFPHFMAIAWLYRADYARAGLAMLPAIEGADGIAGREAIVYASALIPVSLIPCTTHLAGPLYAAAALLLGLVYLASSLFFAWHESRFRARVLLIVSLIYLPALYLFSFLDPLVRAALRS